MALLELVLPLISASFPMQEHMEQRKGTVLVVTPWRPLLTLNCKLRVQLLGTFCFILFFSNLFIIFAHLT